MARIWSTRSRAISSGIAGLRAQTREFKKAAGKIWSRRDPVQSCRLSARSVLFSFTCVRPNDHYGYQSWL